MTQSLEPRRRFIDALDALVQRDDRAALAALRRGLGKAPGAVVEMHRYVEPWLPHGAERWQEDAYYLVAALFAWHPRDWRQGGERDSNFGASFARLRAASGSESVEQRLIALLNAHPDDLPEHLRSAVSLLRAAEVPINWALLLRDIQRWSWESRVAQRNWAGAFWGQAGREPSESSAVAPEDPAGPPDDTDEPDAL